MPRHPLPSLPSGSSVLLDANVLIYAVSRSSRECEQLLLRCQIEDLSGFTTVEVINEACHRLMLAEAVAFGLISKPNAGALKGRPHAIGQLRRYWHQVQRILDSNILVLELTEARIRRAQALRQQHGLMTTDSVILAAASELGIENIATNDQEFAAIDTLASYYATDI